MLVKLGMMQNKIIGLIGGSGAGKGMFCSVAKQMGYTIIDGDEISHYVLQNDAKEELVSAFGTSILDDSNTISRKVLGEIVFKNKEKLDTLNSIVHKFVEREIKERITDKCVIDAAVLHLTPVFKKCTTVVAVIADCEIKIKRIMARDGLSRENAINRIASQPTNEQYMDLADYVIENNGDEQDFIKKAKECLQNI